MKISFEERGGDTVFRIDDVDSKYVPAFQSCFYQREGQSFIKKFSKDTKDLAVIQRNYTSYAQEMFNQLGNFHPTPWENALTAFAERMDIAKVGWWLVGSCAASIRGILIVPHDIDIMIDSKDVGTVHRLFLDHIIEPIIDTQGWVTKDFGVIFLHARIDIASDPSPSSDKPEPSDFGPFAEKHLEEVIWNGYRIKVPPLNLYLNVNKRRGRLDRVKLVEEYISRNK